MTQSPTLLKGIVHGNMIEFAVELGLPDGQEVTVTVQPSAGGEETPAGRGIAACLRRLVRRSR